MGKKGTPERSTAPPEVTVISITITELPPVRGRPLRERLPGIGLGHRARTALAIALTLAGLGAIAATELQSSRTSRPAGARRARVQGAERAAIAAAFGYPYPLRCLTITISSGNPDYATADVDRTNGCERYHGYLDASFHRVDGTWRLVLDEGQLFVPNGLLTPCSPGPGGCSRAGGTPGGKGPHLRTVSSRGVPAAYGHPFDCPSSTIAVHDPRFARAGFDRIICIRARPG